MLRFQKDLQSGYFANYTVTDLLFFISCIFMIFAAVAYTIATSQSIPLSFRLVFFLLLGISFIKIDFFLPLLATLLIIDYFSIRYLGILPSDQKYIIYLIFIPLALNFKYCFFNFYTNRFFLIFAALFLLYTFLVTRLNGSMESHLNILVMIFILLLGFVSSSKTLYLLFGSLIFSSFLLALQGFILQDELINFANDSTGRLKWTDPNYMCIIIDFGILLSFYLLLIYKNVFFRIITICFLLFLFYIVLLLGSRGGLIVCLISILYLFHKNIFTFKFIYYMVGISTIVYSFYYFGFLEIILARFQEGNLDSAGGRTPIWDRILTVLSQRSVFSLLFGTGSYSSQYVYSIVYSLRSPHNNYLEFFYDYGLIGLSLFLGVISYIFLNSKNILSQAVIIFILLSAVALSPFNYAFSWLYLLFALFTYKLKSIFVYEEKLQ